MFNKFKNPSFFVMTILIIGFSGFNSNLEASAFNRVIPLETKLRNALLVGEKLYYHQDGTFWVTDGTPEGTQVLINKGRPFVFTSFIGTASINELVYTFAFLEEGNRLWVTDGTVEGTRQALDLEPATIANLVTASDHLFFNQSNDGLVVTDGNPSGTTIYPIESSFLQTLCAIDESRFYISGRKNFDDNALYFVSNNEVVEVDTEALPFEINLFDQPQLFNQQCFYRAIDPENNQARQLIRLDQNMDAAMINVPGDTQKSISRTVFGDRLLLSRSGPKIYALSDQSTQADVAIDSDSFSGNVIFYDLADFQVVQDKIYLSFDLIAPNASPPPPATGLILNQEFEQVGAYNPRTFKIQAQNEPLALDIRGKDFLFFEKGTRQVDVSRSGLFEFDINAPNISVTQLIASQNQSNDAVYAIGLDRSRNNQETLYRFDSSPNISELQTGIWTSPELENQGLIISSGTNASGQQFLFAALFTYDNGQPTWLAGNVLYKNGQTSIQFDLFKFTGLDFLDLSTSVPADAERIGEIELIAMGCAQLAMNLDLLPPFESRQLMLSRSEDQSKSNLCSN